MLNLHRNGSELKSASARTHGHSTTASFVDILWIRSTSLHRVSFLYQIYVLLPCQDIFVGMFIGTVEVTPPIAAGVLSKVPSEVMCLGKQCLLSERED